ncbi:TPA: EspF repeat-containing protein [Escherichia coli]|nr:hypothetical protein ECE128010_4697 [Escherichia coli E128010]EGE1565306.1 hypothetical protein [Escherichia coli]EIQ69237.1 hypothetical protein ECEPECC34262_3390 [Escherichia coli EPEC C342-62]HAJ1846937.1 hypothetical protein [Escherichia coli]
MATCKLQMTIFVAAQPLPDVAQRLIDHLAEHGIKTSRNS